jgi:antitoxin YefM
MSAQDYESEQETLHVLQNSNLIQQLSNSLKTHINNQGYSPSAEELNEIVGI